VLHLSTELCGDVSARCYIRLSCRFFLDGLIDVYMSLFQVSFVALSFVGLFVGFFCMSLL